MRLVVCVCARACLSVNWNSCWRPMKIWTLFSFINVWNGFARQVSVASFAAFVGALLLLPHRFFSSPIFFFFKFILALLCSLALFVLLRSISFSLLFIKCACIHFSSFYFYLLFGYSERTPFIVWHLTTWSLPYKNPIECYLHLLSLPLVLARIFRFVPSGPQTVDNNWKVSRNFGELEQQAKQKQKIWKSRRRRNGNGKIVHRNNCGSTKRIITIIIIMIIWICSILLFHIFCHHNI